MIRKILVCMMFVVGCQRDARPQVVVYCALDREFADDILAEFEKSSGIQVVKRYDTEANKAVGLVHDLIEESARPRCDVHWNNEMLGSMRLQEKGVYELYHGRTPARPWVAFAARARVFLVNSKLVKEPPKNLNDLTDPKWKGKVAMAKPEFGTTATHAACLFQAWGEEKAGAFFEKLRDNGVRLLPGNKHVAVAVGKGDYAIGWTDTDDAFGEIDAGKPVRIVIPGDLLIIPNTVGIIKNCPHPKEAAVLMEYLLRPEVEEKLSKAKSRQIPLNEMLPEPQGLEGVRGRPGQLVYDTGLAAWHWEDVQRRLRVIFVGD